MIELLTYPTAQLPPLWKWQILAFQRIVWTDGFIGENQGRDWITRASDHPLSMLLVDGQRLLGHVNVVWKMLSHAGTHFKAYGLTGVFTFPDVRGMGYGLQLVQDATGYIDQQDADIAMFHCDADNMAFYQRAGWETLPDAHTWIGSPAAPILVEETLMMRFRSSKGQQYRAAFEREPIFFGSDSTW